MTTPSEQLERRKVLALEQIADCLTVQAMHTTGTRGTRSAAQEVADRIKARIPQIGGDDG